MKDEPYLPPPTDASAYDLWASTPQELKRVVIRVNRLARLHTLEAPALIIENESKLVAKGARAAIEYLQAIYAGVAQYDNDDDA